MANEQGNPNTDLNPAELISWPCAEASARSAQLSPPEKQLTHEPIVIVMPDNSIAYTFKEVGHPEKGCTTLNSGRAVFACC